MEGLPDLKGQKVVVAVENAYPPFNSIDEATRQQVSAGIMIRSPKFANESIVFPNSSKLPGMASSPPWQPENTIGWRMV